MAFKRSTFLLKLYQYSTLLPFDYDLINQSFRYNKFFFYYSSFLSTYIVLSSTYSVYKWVDYSLNISKLFNLTDLLFITILWISNIIVGYFIMRDKMFHVHRIIELANNIWRIHRYGDLDNEKFLPALYSQTMIYVICFPSLLFIVNGIFFATIYKNQFNVIYYCISITFCMTWVRLSFFPIFLLFTYFKNSLNYYNNIISLLNTSTEKRMYIIQEIEKYSVFYSEIVKLVRLISKYFGFHIIFYLLGLNIGMTWMWYRTIDTMFLGLIQYQNSGINYQMYVMYSFLICNIMVIGRTNMTLFKSIGLILIEANRANDIVNDLYVEMQKSNDRQMVC